MPIIEPWTTFTEIARPHWVGHGGEDQEIRPMPMRRGLMWERLLGMLLLKLAARVNFCSFGFVMSHPSRSIRVS